MLLDSILERNRSFTAARRPQALPPPEQMPLAVVACYDPRLDSLLLSALGLEPGQAFLLRTAGALVQPAGGVMRSLGLAIFMFGATEVIVVGHSSCRMAAFDGRAFIDMFRRRGVQREAFGTADLRDWAGAIPSPRRGVQLSVENIRSAPFLPRDVAVSGLVLDDTTGALEVVARGEPGAAPAKVPSPATPEALEAAAEKLKAGEEMLKAPADRLEAAPEAPNVGAERPDAAADMREAASKMPQRVRVSGGAREARPDPEQDVPLPARPDPEKDVPLPAHFEKLLKVLESKLYWRQAAQELRRDLRREPSAAARASLLEVLAQRAAADSREVAAALQDFQAAVRGRDHARASGPATRSLTTPPGRRR